MSNYWFENPYILLENTEQFFPKKEYTRTEKINAIARFAIYYSIIIIFMKLDTKYLSVAVCLIILSYLLGITEKFNSEVNMKCTKPTINNPYANFTIGDQMTEPLRPQACPIDSIREEQIKLFRTNMFPEVGDLYGKFLSDRNFYTMPSTTIVNDQIGFAKYLFEDAGKCKSEGKDCLKNRDNRFHKGRYYYQY